jgi:hypothetical protein
MLLPGVLVAAIAFNVSSAAPADAVKPSLESTTTPRPWKEIVLHHSATSAGDVASIDAVHRRQRDRSGKPWLGIGYHFVVGNGHKMADGEIQSTFRWTRQLPGAHVGTDTHNQHAIGICLIGNFDETEPTARQIEAVRRLVKSLAEQYAIPRERLLRHLDVQATLCPGRMFPWELVRADLPPSGGM